ncbi:UDP-glycosyltransferase 708G1-like [Humulus lupulus]|uniref:UDP-glycosyltransferase 708G1-like n=1 Tax=Humulus lupulus TaxID=3486 RepID=UPI002B4037B4|nr:UDP-glycosyltransferase 708G1-like [Humulus lupulus]XP_062111348.1 UDP-glycosyltransferase 708G1-like [Humulus lupulus]XP_062111349.1 UDP-glycosyltransferase 708G1-like [Humulus lupulus]XP_062111350.1 UDP-glycosyltransferase 708G1-like [Humulus lupulus]XP_062111351.1 UDP-glycosyltransferase 708G1-like [Humulus lupulus]
MSSSGDLLNTKTTHVALFPSAGMGHLIPFLRFAALLLRRSDCRVTLITINPTVSLAESRHTSQFLSAFPQVIHLQLELLPVDPATVNSDDPFWLRFEAIRRSAHLLGPLLSSTSPPLSALVHDVSLVSPVIPIAQSLSLPSYVLFPASARMLSFVSYYPAFASGFESSNSGPFEGGLVRIPSISPIPKSSIPTLLLDPKSLFAQILMEDSPNLSRLNGILVNSFEGLESDSLKAINAGKVSKALPPLFTVGPFPPFEFEKVEWSTPTTWLDQQPDGSVVYVCFGSRTALSRDQTREVGEGLVKSGYRFMWILKNMIVDREDYDDLKDVVGSELMEKMKGRGLVIKQWVDQGEILGHRAVGGFLSHCGWNSIVEAALLGVKILAWPLHGDQGINAEVVRDSGLGIWVESWGLGCGGIKSNEIGERVREFMGNESLRRRAAEIGDMATQATVVGGSQEKTLGRLIQEWDKRKMAKE